ncbi:MAG: IS110 family transposase [Acidobacteria bacterium]|nr:IS110 family transposase [Acidobacteriota bacterium]
MPADPRKALRREILLRTAEQLSGNIREIERRLEEEGGIDPRVALLRTQAGVGILTALCLIHTLGEVARFSSSRQVVAFAGLCPLEKSSGARVASAGSAVRGRRCCATCSGRRRTRRPGGTNG